MVAWRQLGLNYINYSNIAARVLRQSIRTDAQAQARGRDKTFIKCTPWVDGKATPKIKASSGSQ